MSISDCDLKGTEWEQVQDTVRVHARNFKKKNPHLDYWDLYQAGWIGALAALEKHGKEWRFMRNLAGQRICGEILRFISRSCNSRGDSFAETIRFDKSIVRNSDIMEQVPAKESDVKTSLPPEVEEAIDKLGSVQRMAINLFFRGSENGPDVLINDCWTPGRINVSKFHAIKSLRRILGVPSKNELRRSCRSSEIHTKKVG